MRKRTQRGVYTTGDVAILCRVSQQTVIRWIDSGILPSFRIPNSNHRRVKCEDLVDFANAHRLTLDDDSTRLKVFTGESDEPR